VNDFDELIGADVAGEERERLLGVHEQLVEAGPPPELSAHLQETPQPGNARSFRKRSAPWKFAMIAAAVILLAITFTVGISIGKGSVASPVASIALRGTKAAPRAKGTLDVLPEVSGNHPMNLSVSRLPAVTAPEYYSVWLVRNGKPFAPCGEFVVSKHSRSLTLTLNAPYTLETGDTWIVTRKMYKQQPGAGATVLRPTTSTASTT
jgi:hypothetical protein